MVVYDWEMRRAEGEKVRAVSGMTMDGLFSW